MPQASSPPSHRAIEPPPLLALVHTQLPRLACLRHMHAHAHLCACAGPHPARHTMRFGRRAAFLTVPNENVQRQARVCQPGQSIIPSARQRPPPVCGSALHEGTPPSCMSACVCRACASAEARVAGEALRLDHSTSPACLRLPLLAGPSPKSPFGFLVFHSETIGQGPVVGFTLAMAVLCPDHIYRWPLTHGAYHIRHNFSLFTCEKAKLSQCQPAHSCHNVSLPVSITVCNLLISVMLVGCPCPLLIQVLICFTLVPSLGAKHACQLMPLRPNQC